MTPEIAIIGAGPVGLFSIFECGMLKMHCHVIDALPSVGGQCSALYPEKPIYDIPGHPQIAAQDLIDQLAEQSSPFSPTFHLNQQVVSLTKEGAAKEGGDFLITTSSGTLLRVQGVIIAAGVGAFGPNRPPLENIDQFENKSVFYYVQRKEDFRDKRIVIAGGGDSAVDWALSLVDVAAKVYVVHRRPKFRAAPESEARLMDLAQKGALELVTPYQLKAIKGTNGFCDQILLESLDGEEKTLEADVLLPFYGLSMNLGPIAEWNLHLERNHIQVEPLTMQTNIPGVYAVGDIATYPHKLKLILSGFAEAAQAAHALRSRLYPDEVRHFEYSTTQGVPQLSIPS